MTLTKAAAAILAIAITFAAAGQQAHATTIAPSERISFREGTTLLNAANGPASTTISPNAPAGTVIDGAVQVDVTKIQFWWRSRTGQSYNDARIEAANSWNFTLSNGDTTVDLGGLPGAVNDHWFRTNAFDGLSAGGDWVLSATSDYYAASKRMIQFHLAGFFNVKPGEVPVPAPILLILAGMVGIAGMRRKA